jgi:hypothetical protein
MEHFRLFIERIAPVEAKNGKFYYSFWVRVILEDLATLTVSGWKYFPVTGTVSEPSVAKGKGKFFNTSKANGPMYNMILLKAQKEFGYEVKDQ